MDIILKAIYKSPQSEIIFGALLIKPVVGSVC